MNSRRAMSTPTRQIGVNFQAYIFRSCVFSALGLFMPVAATRLQMMMQAMEQMPTLCAATAAEWLMFCNVNSQLSSATVRLRLCRRNRHRRSNKASRLCSKLVYFISYDGSLFISTFRRSHMVDEKLNCSM